MWAEEDWERLATCRVAVLGTVNPDGTPHLVPFTFAALEAPDLVCAIDSKPKSTRRLRRLDNVARDPRVTVLAHHYDDDWSELWWIRAAGTAVVTDDIETSTEATLVAKYPQYARHRLSPWITITVETLQTWTADG